MDIIDKIWVLVKSSGGEDLRVLVLFSNWQRVVSIYNKGRINSKFMSEKDQISEPDMIQHAQEWLNDHGQPSYSHLKKIAEEGTVESRDQLLELADEYNIQYDKSTSVNELIEKIRLFMNLGSHSS